MEWYRAVCEVGLERGEGEHLATPHAVFYRPNLDITRRRYQIRRGRSLPQIKGTHGTGAANEK